MRFLPVLTAALAAFSGSASCAFSPVSAPLSAQAAALPTNLTWPATYHLKAVLSLPYADLHEPVDFWIDTDKALQKIVYYDGVDQYGSLGKENGGTTWQVVPVIDEKQCFFQSGVAHDDPASVLAPFLPDLKGFSLDTEKEYFVKGQTAFRFSYEFVGEGGNATNTYHMYVSSLAPHVPLLYTMFGYDSLIGSHYDEYIVSYTHFSTEEIDEKVFAMPEKDFKCQNSTANGGPSIDLSFSSPAALIRTVFPSSSASPAQLSPEYSQFLASQGLSSGRFSLVRQQLFHANNMLITLHNRRFNAGKSSFNLKMNQFADWTKEEMKSKKGRVHTSKAAFSPYVFSSPSSVPAEIDWRSLGKVTPVQDQATCGSCWSFGSTGAITAAFALKYNQTINFSQQQLMDCSWKFENAACNGGEDTNAYEYVMNAGGIASMEDYGPYMGQDMFCKKDAIKDAKTKAVIKSYVLFNGTDALVDAIATKGPISVSINASPTTFSFYNSGVYDDKVCTGAASDLDHSVLAVGYGEEDGKPYYLVKNSWSTHWGDEGYIKISRDNNVCGVADCPTYVILE